MNSRCDSPNPLIRDGVSQHQREPKALSPAFVQVDEWELADFLVFAHRLSQQVNFFGEDNQKAGSWQTFFQHSTPVQIALISKARPESIKERYDLRLNQFFENPDNYSEEERLAGLINTLIVDLVRPLWHWHERLDTDTPLKAIVHDSIKTTVSPAVRSLAINEANYRDRFGKTITAATFYTAFSRTFDLNLPEDSDQFFGLASAPEALSESLWLPLSADSDEGHERIQDNIDTVFQSFFQAYQQIVAQAPQYLEASLNHRQDHSPHLALYIAFVDTILKPVRTDLNRMTQQHLDFFYKKGLQLTQHRAQPDSANVVFELAIAQSQVALAAGTLLKAGKDAQGQDRRYALDRDVVLNRAQVISLKALFLESEERVPPGYPPQQLLGLYASEVANSVDGQGKDFPKTQAVKSWLPFGNFTRIKDALARPQGLLGLGIVSDIFSLQEGNRTVTFFLTLDAAPNAVLTAEILSKLFKVDFSGAATWITGSVQAEVTGTTLVLEVQIDAEQGAIVAYSEQLSGSRFSIAGVNQPVARLMLKEHLLENNLSPYRYFREMKLQSMTVSVTVDELRSLTVRNDLSVLDANKPFQPFGPRPQVGDSFYIESPEIFSKKLTELTLSLDVQPSNVNWEEAYAGYPLPNPFKPGTINIQTVKAKNWMIPTDTTENLFTASPLTLSVTPSPSPTDKSRPNASDGFFRLTLAETDFLQDQYAAALTRQIMAQAKNPDVVTVIPQAPITPRITDIHLSYEAQADSSDCRLFHLLPFDGIEEKVPNQMTFLPQFMNEGELFIGLQDLEPASELNLLFQIAAETANGDLLTDVRYGVQWHYLKDNQWRSMRDRIVHDHTYGLTTSGILTLAIPADISKAKTTLLDSHLHWLKASVPARSGTIGQIIGIHTQAAQVTFRDRNNDPNHSASPLPAKTIIKIASPRSEIKSVTQPYPSFSGRALEQSSAFYTRISERLRHKGRAIAIFDYERWVLEHFSQIYKVRCLNHGQVDAAGTLHELVPGAVALVVIPNLSMLSATNLLQPKVNVNVRNAIQRSLAQVSSPWATVQVINPQYEQIQVEFKVRFKAEAQANASYYKRILDQAIVSYLSPWETDSTADISFGGKVYRSSILKFVEEQPYVDYILDFYMHLEEQKDLKEAAPSSAHAILTSVPAFNAEDRRSKSHRITVI